MPHIAGKSLAPDPAKSAKSLMTRASTYQTRNSKRLFKTPIITPRRLVKPTTLNLLELRQKLGDITAAARWSGKEFVHRPKTVSNGIYELYCQNGLSFDPDRVGSERHSTQSTNTVWQFCVLVPDWQHSSPQY
jgi:hypothetical protein